MLAEHVAEFLAEKKRRKATATYEQYRVVLETVFMPWCQSDGIRNPRDVTDKVMDRFVDHLGKHTHGKSDKPLSAASIRTYVRTVRIFLNWCEVPKGRFEMPRQPRRIIHTLTRQEIDLLERVADNERDKLIVRVLADTGVRISELLWLALGDLKANTYERKYLVEVIGKGDKQRGVPIPATTYARLEKFAKAGGGGFIFKNNRGGRLDKHRVSKMLSALGKKAWPGEERRVYAHLFRHSWVTQQVRNMKSTGVSLIDIQRTAGHSSLAMVSTVYAHTQPADSYDQLMAGLKG